MTGRVYNVLFLCTGNSARSIIAEAYLNSKEAPHMRAFSAGGTPRGYVHPNALELLETLKIPIDNLRSKSWDEFSSPGAPIMDLIVNLCDQTAGEECPSWPGQPVTSSWSIPDPATIEGSELLKRLGFRDVGTYLRRRIDILLSFRMEMLDRIAIKRGVDEMGLRGAGDSDNN